MTTDNQRTSLLSAHTAATDTATVISDLSGQLIAGQRDPSLIVFFCGHQLDGAALASGLAGRMPGASVVGCSSAGEFTQRAFSSRGAAALAFPRSVAPRVATAVVDVTGGIIEGVETAAEDLERQLGTRLRDLDPQRYVGLVLIDGLSSQEEEINQALGRVAPFLSFVGGSAADDLEYERTWMATDRLSVDRGAVLAVIELSVPYTVLKTCSFVPTAHSFTVTRADALRRIVYELDGRPVLDVYAEAFGVTPDKLDDALFRRHPMGVMIDTQPWIRAPQAPMPDGSLRLYCRLPEDTKIHLMEATDLIQDTRTALAASAAQLGGDIRGGLLFNCVHRRLDLDETGRLGEYVRIFEDIPVAGLHTYGESWLGHINQTCTGLLLG